VKGVLWQSWTVVALRVPSFACEAQRLGDIGTQISAMWALS
jgi:hypothetical protein